MKEVFSFTLKDDTDSIKCTCWGGMSVHSNCFNLGDIVQIDYPDIKVRKPI